MILVNRSRSYRSLVSWSHPSSESSRCLNVTQGAVGSERQNYSQNFSLVSSLSPPEKTPVNIGLLIHLRCQTWTIPWAPSPYKACIGVLPETCR